MTYEPDQKNHTKPFVLHPLIHRQDKFRLKIPGVWGGGGGPLVNVMGQLDWAMERPDIW